MDHLHSYEQEILKIDFQEETNHQTDTHTMQSKFKRNVQSLKAMFEELGNPFWEESMELYNVLRKVASKSVVDTLMNIQNLGETQYAVFA